MRFFAFLFAAALLAPHTTTRGTQSGPQDVGRAQAPVPIQDQASVDSVVQFLLTSAASDFHAHGPSGPLRFREVRIGHVIILPAEKQYRLCGQFMRAQQGVTPQWTPFATIKTSGYEQWIGAQAVVFCQDSSIIWDNVRDLSSSLQGRLDSLR